MPIIASIIFSIFILTTSSLTNFSVAEEINVQQLQALTQKANNGDMQAQADLASRYHTGDGVTQNTKQAAYWYEKLAENGVAEAQLTLGLIYIKGDGVTPDDKQALYWLNLAAEQRLASAQYLLGIAYAEGHGVEIDKIKAYMWYEIAAAMVNKNAVEARTELAKQMNKEDIFKAEQMATEWWMQFHH